MRELVRRNLRFFVAVSGAALLLRLIFIRRFPSVVNDSFVYGDIAKNWVQRGIYGVSIAAQVSPTYIRLPGYPAFLALIFRVFGMEHYHAVLITQMFVDLGTCLICADLAQSLLGGRRAKAAFLLAALCPFTANYSAAALTETLEVFFTALALDFTCRALQNSKLRDWAGCGICCAAAVLLRPDGVLLVLSILVFLAWKIAFSGSLPALAGSRRRLVQAAFLVGVLSTVPLVPWTVRNWRVFHRFQPLAPRYANEEAEFVPVGFNRWVKTWIADYVSVEEVYWQVPGNTIDVSKLPSRAFDDPLKTAETTQVINDYNQVLHVSPSIDSRFEVLAAARIRAHPLRYYFWLPALRIADMWLRPRTEMLPADTRWWEFNDEPRWSVLAVSLGVINLFYMLAACVGWLKRCEFSWTGLLVLFVVLRSVFLGTLENPEPRYTLEMYPVIFVFAAIALTRSAGQSEVQKHVP